MLYQFIVSFVANFCTSVRVMRMISALGLVLEVAKEEYKALPVTQVMAAPPMMAAQRHL
jgi:hypothetical protein